MRQLYRPSVELFLIALATVCALILRDDFEVSEANLAALAPYLVFTMAAAAFIFPALRTNRSLWQFTNVFDFFLIAAATVATVIGAVTLGFSFNRLEGIPRALPFIQSLLSVFLLVGARILRRFWIDATERHVQQETPKKVSSYETVLVVGAGKLADFYLRSVAEFAPDRVRIAGVVSQNDRHIGRRVAEHLIVGTPEQLSDVLRDLKVHGVFVDSILVATAFEKLTSQAQDALLDLDKATNIKLKFLLDQLGLAQRSSGPAKAEQSSADATDSLNCFCADDLLALRRRPYWRVKRALDFVAALILLLVLAPLILFAAILVVIDVGLPVTFWQLRPGLEGRALKLHKFRTMAAAHDAYGRRVPDEERTSNIGRLLRRTRVDEFPQLLSILSGEMSFVGPRPLLPVDQPAKCAARLLVPPGLTGWAQVKGGRAISAADKAALDIWYLRNASAALDLEILARTVPMVLFGESVDAAAIQTAWRELHQAGMCRRELCAEVGDGEGERRRIMGVSKPPLLH